MDDFIKKLQDRDKNNGQSSLTNKQIKTNLEDINSEISNIDYSRHTQPYSIKSPNRSSMKEELIRSQNLT